MKYVSALCPLAIIATLAFVAAPASAQPGAEPPPDYPGTEDPVARPDPYPQQQPEQPRAIRMSHEERELLLQGEIDPGLHIAGGLVGMFVPFGAGSAIQGRWHSHGWKFTLGEGVSLGVMIAGFVRLAEDDSLEDDGDVLLVIGGALGFAGFWIWEMIDNWVGPALHNERVRRLHYKYGIAPGSVFYGAAPYVAPTGRGGAVAGLTFRL